MKFRHVIPTWFMVTAILSCKSDLSNTPLPKCLADQTHAPQFSQVYVQIQEGQPYYWLYGASEGDGNEPIVTASCDTVCHFDGWGIHPPCLEEYSDDWTLIWTR